MIIETIFLGILLGFIYYEFVGLTPGGIIVPGYLALYLFKPLVLISTFAVVMMTFFIVKGLSQLIILYGRRAFLAAVLVGFLLKFLIETTLFKMTPPGYDLQIIGYIIPGLIAHEMRKQGIGETAISLFIVSGAVKFLIQIQDAIFK